MSPGLIYTVQIWAMVFISCGAWLQAILHYQDEEDWRWNEELSFSQWLMEDKLVLFLASFPSLVLVLGLVFH